MNTFAFPDSLLSAARALLLGKLQRYPQPWDRQGLQADEAVMHGAVGECVRDILLRWHPELFFDRPGLLREKAPLLFAPETGGWDAGPVRFSCSVSFGAEPRSPERETPEPDVLSITVANHALLGPVPAGQRLRVPGNREFPDFYHSVATDYRLYQIRFSAPPSLKPRDPEFLYAIVGTLLDTAHQWFRARFERLFFGGERFSLLPALDSIVRPYFNDETLLSQLQFIIDTPDTSFYCFNEERLDTPLRNIAQHFPGVSPELLLAEVAGHLMPAGQKFSGLVNGAKEAFFLDLPYVRYHLSVLGRYPEAEIALFLSPAVTLFNLCETPGYNLRVTVPSRYTNAFRCFKQPLLRKHLANVFQTKLHQGQMLNHIRDLQEHCTLLPDFSDEEVLGRSRPEAHQSPAKRSTVFLSRSLTSTAGAAVQALLFEAVTLPDAERLTETRREGRTDFELFPPPLPPPDNPRRPPLEEPDQAAEFERLRAENEYLQQEIKYLDNHNIELQKEVARLRNRAESYMERFDQLHTTVRELQEKYNAVMERIAEPAVSQQGKVVPEQPGEFSQEIIEALRNWPKERMIIKGVDGKNRKENAEQYLKRVYDLDRYGKLYLFDLKKINKKLYQALCSLKSRRAIADIDFLEAATSTKSSQIDEDAQHFTSLSAELDSRTVRRLSYALKKQEKNI